MTRSGNSPFRLPLSRDGQGKIIGEKIERQTGFGCTSVRNEFNIVRHPNKKRRGKKIREGIWQGIAIQWLAKKHQQSDI